MVWIIILILIIIIIICILKFEFFTEINNDFLYTALIIEPRKHKALNFVLKNFIGLLDRRWKFIIFHGNLNEDFILEIINNNFITELDRIRLINLNVDNLTIDEYNLLLTNLNFYKNINTEYFLIFQTDTIICENNKNNIYDFIEKDYDYVGARFPIFYNSNVCIGNGGLSLRKKSKMIEVLNTCEINNRGETPEDIYFSTCLNLHIPACEEADLFAQESRFFNNSFMNYSFGFHKPWYQDQLSEIELEYIESTCPGIRELIYLNT
jgi:hypothetical protein